jgi:hypothetical protein
VSLILIAKKRIGMLDKRTALRVHQFAQRESHFDGTETDTAKWLTTHGNRDVATGSQRAQSTQREKEEERTTQN